MNINHSDLDARVVISEGPHMGETGALIAVDFSPTCEEYTFFVELDGGNGECARLSDESGYMIMV